MTVLVGAVFSIGALASLLTARGFTQFAGVIGLVTAIGFSLTVTVESLPR